MGFKDIKSNRNRPANRRSICKACVPGIALFE